MMNIYDPTVEEINCLVGRAIGMRVTMSEVEANTLSEFSYYPPRIMRNLSIKGQRPRGPAEVLPNFFGDLNWIAAAEAKIPDRHPDGAAPLYQYARILCEVVGARGAPPFRAAAWERCCALLLLTNRWSVASFGDPSTIYARGLHWQIKGISPCRSQPVDRLIQRRRPNHRTPARGTPSTTRKDIYENPKRRSIHSLSSHGRGHAVPWHW